MPLLCVCQLIYINLINFSPFIGLYFPWLIPQQALDKPFTDKYIIIKQKWIFILFYSNRKAHLLSISDVPIYNSILSLLQALPVTVYKSLFFSVSSTILMTAYIFLDFSAFCISLVFIPTAADRNRTVLSNQKYWKKGALKTSSRLRCSKSVQTLVFSRHKIGYYNIKTRILHNTNKCIG